MNKHIFTGNLGKDCRVGDVNGNAVVNFTVAVKAGWGEKSQTLWLDCALWGKRAEGDLKNYLLKGQQVAVCGELGTREHEGKTYLTIRVDDLDLVGGKPDSAAPTQQAAAPQTTKAPIAAPAPKADDFDDDIPF